MTNETTNNARWRIDDWHVLDGGGPHPDADRLIEAANAALADLDDRCRLPDPALDDTDEAGDVRSDVESMVYDLLIERAEHYGIAGCMYEDKRGRAVLRGMPHATTG